LQVTFYFSCPSIKKRRRGRVRGRRKHRRERACAVFTEVSRLRRTSTEN